MLLRFSLIFLSIFLVAPNSYPQQKIQVFYNISCELDLNKKTLQGKETIQLTNGLTVPLNELYLSLGMNAFSSLTTSFFKGFLLWKGLDKEFKEFGNIDILSVKFNDNEIKENFQFISPDGNKGDKTLAVLKIPSPILSGQTVSIEIQFITKPPQALSGIGHIGNYFSFYCWYPKVCSLEEVDGKIKWSYCQLRFPPVTESIFGSYRVEINVPRNVKVGATGAKIYEKKIGKRKVVRFYAENVIDFIWFASPLFLEYKESLIPEKDFPLMDLKKLEKMERAEEKREKIDIYLLIRPERKIYKERYLKSIKESLRFFWLNFSKYPYSSLTFVDYPLSEETTEILTPNIIKCGHLFFTAEDSLYIEKKISREISKQYFGYIVNNYRIDEVWISNGISTYLENQLVREKFDESVRYKYFAFFPIPSFEPLSLPLLGFYLKKMKEEPELPLLLDYLKRYSLDQISKSPWDFQNLYSFNLNANVKPALILLTLERYFGKHKIFEALKEIHKRYSFKKMGTEDFLRIIEEKLGINARKLFEHYLNRASSSDFRVVEVKNDEWENGRDKFFLSSVLIEKEGDFNFPVDIEISWENGEKILERWDGNGNWKRFSYVGKSKIIKVVIDPLDKFLLDENRFNNSFCLKIKKKSLLKVFVIWHIILGKFFHNLSFFI